MRPNHLTASFPDGSQERVVAACVPFLAETLETASRAFPTGPPSTVRTAFVMEPVEPGHYTSRGLEKRELDIGTVVYQIMSVVEGTPSWRVAEQVVRAYIEVNRIAPGSFFSHDISRHYLWPLFTLYVERCQAFSFDANLARGVSRSLIEHLDTPILDVRGLITLTGLRAAKPFRLEPGITVRPLTEDDVWLLREHNENAIGVEPWPPNADAWICELTLPNRRGTAAGFNDVHPIGENVAWALRMFKGGGFVYRFGRTEFVGHFGGSGLSRNIRETRTSAIDSTYSLDETEVDEFVAFWPSFRQFAEQPAHYLHAPARRLRTGGGRTVSDDALIDYVIGLEALLGTASERTELAFRFRIRGSIVLGKDRDDRKRYIKILQDLYDLRSRLVHGQVVPETQLAAALPAAEDALRRVWAWHFTKWYNEPSNEAAVKSIDEQLVGS